MRGYAVASILAAAGALAAGGEGQKPLGRLSAPLDVARSYLSCEETYGKGWVTCGDRVCSSHLAGSDGVANRRVKSSRFCYSPALGQVSGDPSVLA